MYATDAYDFNSVFFTAVGVIVLWGKLGPDRMKVYALSNLIRTLVSSDRLTVSLEFAVFLFIGVVAAVGIVQPTTIAQAISAGLGWTGLFSHAPTRSP